MASLHIDSKTGEFHIHVAYGLMRATATTDGCFVQRLGKYENKLQLYAREVELKYGLQILSNEPRPGARRADRNELEESRRLGTDIHAIRSAILDSLQKSDNGRAFEAAIKERGWRSRRRPAQLFVVIDRAGGQARAQQETHRHDAEGDQRAAWRPRQDAASLGRSGASRCSATGPRSRRRRGRNTGGRQMRPDRRKGDQTARNAPRSPR